MTISTSDLTGERQVLEKDFEALSSRIKQVDQELIQMKSNLNAVHGAIQQVDKLIALSEKYYDSALYAIKYIPIKSRFSILLALRLYQSIGKKIKRNKKIFFSNKINTNKFEKFIILNTCIIEFIFKHVFSFNSRKHNAQLHDALKGLPFINEKI